MRYAFPVTVTRLRWSYTTDDLGDVVRSATPVASSIPGCAVAPRASGDLTEPARQGVLVGLTLYAPLETDLDRVTDQIEHGGAVFDIDGDVGVWLSPFARGVDGIEVALRRAVG